MYRTSGLATAVLALALVSSIGVSPASAAVGASPITITPSPLNFNAPQETAKTVAVVIANVSGAPVTFGSTSIAGTDAGDVAIALDTCANHTIRANQHCRTQFTMNATQAVGAVETATVSYNDPSSNLLGSVDINAKVTRSRGLTVTAVGDVVTIKNPTTNSYGADWSPMGSVSVTGGTCVDYIFPTSTCTILVTGSPGTLEVFISGLNPFILTF